MKALRITFDPATGRRAGGIVPRSEVWKGLRGNREWQNLDEGVEVRLVEDESVLDNIDLDDPDVTLLEGEQAISDAINGLDVTPEEQYAIASEALVAESVRQRGLDLTEAVDAEGDPLQGPELAKWLHERGVVGVNRRRIPRTMPRL